MIIVVNLFWLKLHLENIIGKESSLAEVVVLYQTGFKPFIAQGWF